MLNRILFLLVAVGAPASAAAMLYVGTHPAGTVVLADRLPCLGLALVALLLAVLHARSAANRASAAEAAMWGGLAMFFFVALFASPQLGAAAVVAVLALAGTSVVRLADRVRHLRASPGRIQRRIFA